MLDSVSQVTSVPWLLECVQPTGMKWGSLIAGDATIHGIPQNLVGIALLVEGRSDCLRLVFGRWDRYEYLGWEDDFTVTVGNSKAEYLIPSSSRLMDGHSVIVKTTADVVPRPLQSSRSIPRILWNISPTIEKRPSHAVRRLMRNIRFINDFVQCTSLYLVVGDEASRREVQESGIPNFIEAYDALIPGSFKADMMRYYLLYRYGGVYADDKSTILHSLDSDAFDSIMINSETGDATDMFIGIIGWGGGVPEIAFMGARAGSPIMLKALEKAIDNIINRRYTDDRLGITGNTMLRGVMDNPSLSRIPDAVPDGIGINWIKCLEENVALLRIENGDVKMYYGPELLWHRQAIPFHDWPKTATYYWNLWNMREVYVDGNPDPSLSAKISKFLAQDGMSTTIGIVLAFSMFGILAFLFKKFPTVFSL